MDRVDNITFYLTVIFVLLILYLTTVRLEKAEIMIKSLETQIMLIEKEKSNWIEIDPNELPISVDFPHKLYIKHMEE